MRPCQSAWCPTLRDPHPLRIPSLPLRHRLRSRRPLGYPPLFPQGARRSLQRRRRQRSLRPHPPVGGLQAHRRARQRHSSLEAAAPLSICPKLAKKLALRASHQRSELPLGPRCRRLAVLAASPSARGARRRGCSCRLGPAHRLPRGDRLAVVVQLGDDDRRGQRRDWIRPEPGPPRRPSLRRRRGGCARPAPLGLPPRHVGRSSCCCRSFGPPPPRGRWWPSGASTLLLPLGLPPRDVLRQPGAELVLLRRPAGRSRPERVP